MPQIRIVHDPNDAPAILSDPQDGAYSDMLVQPQRPPQPEQELTPEQERFLSFRGTADTGPQLGGYQDPGTEAAPPVSRVQGERHHRPLGHLTVREPAVAERYSEVCVYEGWPRRHVRVGRHCPHGYLENHPDGR